MLTRLEVNGFKNLLDLSVDFGAFTCIAGENGTGKSNVFDAIQFLSLLADMPMMDAAQHVRGVHGERIGDLRDLFWNGYEAAERRMSFAAEMIVPWDIEDDFGRAAHPTISFLRYSVEIGYAPPFGIEKIGRLRLLHESLTHINQGDAASRLRFPHSAKNFRSNVIKGRRSGTAFISTSVETGEPVISIHQDGGSRGMPRPAAASRAPATVVSTVTGSDDQTILAARREMQSWRRLALEPSALRTSDRYVDPRLMESDGRHLSGTLYRIAIGESHGDPARIYARVANRLAELAGVSVRGVEVVSDDVRELLTIYLEESSGLRLPARSLSEGTLRFLALCVLLEDPSMTGLYCMEEPENGIHPANLPSMVDLVKDLAVDVTEAPGPDNPFRQIIINTHSPAVVQLVDPGDLLFATSVRKPSPDGTMSRSLVLRPLANTWRVGGQASKHAVTKADILPYLTSPPGAQLSLDLDAA
ncbi:AAA family ATPase [Dactylosporangium aurantiacum]|uniref:AAA family ATPase n=1 Tax=Dactylosporangium aurantiacum TaxID=35754 RepID=A0A9Q9IF26_9ACTN|nr:AAA family ATPase [Dactylosporangium aurantiacum]MDG6102305.1 AAA family ATPase [Dactylosporangium aurantiacum]UWZ53388.1 AAA family ATPase [Dactylosporangium aurantiacum]